MAAPDPAEQTPATQLDPLGAPNQPPPPLGAVPPAAPVETAKPTAEQPVVVATENHLTVFRAGDVEITHAGAPLSREQADELTTLAARSGVRLVDITPKD